MPSPDDPAALAEHCVNLACLRAARGPWGAPVAESLRNAGPAAWTPYAARHGLDARNLYTGLLLAAMKGDAKGPMSDDGRGWGEAARTIIDLGGPTIPGVTAE